MTETLSRPRSLRRHALSAAVTVGLAGAVLAGTATNANAARGDFNGDPDFTGPSTSQVTDDQGGAQNATMYGAYLPSGGVLDGKKVWCADGGLDWPYADAFKAGSDKRINAPKLAYVFDKFDTKKSDKAEAMATDMAISAFVKQSKEIRHRHILDVGSPSWVTGGIGWDTSSKNIRDIGAEKFRNDVAPQAQKLYEQMLEETKNLPATPVSLGVDIDTEKETVTVSLTDADGKQAAGFDANVSIEGATFADGKKAATVKTGDKASTLDIDIKQAGDISANVSVKNIPPTDVIRWSPVDYTDKKASSADPNLNPGKGTKDGYNRYSVQEVYEKAKPTELSASTKASTHNRPSVVTTISDPDLRPGDEVYDNFDVEGLVKGSTVDVHHELWYSPVKPEQTTTAPQDGHTKIAEITSKDVGNGSHKTDTVKLPEDLSGGYLYWRESIPESETTDGWEAEYGIPGETGFIPFTPQGETQVEVEPGEGEPESDVIPNAEGSDEFVTKDEATAVDELPVDVTDTGRISGGMPGQELTVTLEAYQDADGVLEQSPEVPEDATRLSATTVKVVLDENGVGTYNTDKVRLAEELAQPGETTAVTIVETIAETDYSHGTTSDYGIPSESVVVSLPAPPEETPPQETPEKPQPPKNPVVKTGGTEGNGFLATLLGLFR